MTFEVFFRNYPQLCRCGMLVNGARKSSMPSLVFNLFKICVPRPVEVIRAMCVVAPPLR